MNDAEYQKRYFKQRYAEDAEFRQRRHECSNDYRRRRYADDPEYRAKESARCARANRNTRLMRSHGITADVYDAALAAQNGACASCHKKLGRIVRVNRCREPGKAPALLCTPCSERVATVRHVLAHAEGFEAYFKQWNMTTELSRLHALLRQLGKMP